jgi:hypothetical protein
MTKLKLPCDTTIQIEDRKNSRTLTICIERANVFLLGEKYVIVATYDTAKFLRDYLNERFPQIQLASEYHWPTIWRTASGYRVQCRCGWNSLCVEHEGFDDPLRLSWEAHVRAETVKKPVSTLSLSEQMEAELEPRHWTGSHDIGPVLRHGRE